MEYDYDSEDDFYEWEGDYIYAEDSWELADELASGALPEAPALYYREDEWDEHDKYNFWSELEYGNGEIHDGEEALEEQDDTVKAGDKRKRSKQADLKDTIKKIRLRGIQEYPPVVWKPSREVFALRQDCPLYKKPQKPYALLPDWQKRFNYADTTPSADNEKSEDQENPDWEDMSEDDNEDSEDDDGDDDGEEEDSDMPDIDPDLLKSILADKLASSGLAGADQQAFAESLMQMLSGGAADKDDIIKNLTSTLLDQAQQDGAGSSTARWLSDQGIALEEENDEDEQDENLALALAPTAISKGPSPKDSVAAGKSVRKESPAPIPTETKMAGTKRKQASFTPADQTASSEPEAAVLDPGPSNKRAKKATDSTQTPAPGKVVETKPTRPQTKAKKADASKDPQPCSPQKSTRSQAKVTKTEEVPPKPELQKQTRKRKAPNEPVAEEKPKRQLRNFAAPTASSQSKTAESKPTEPKTTRSGRTRK